MRTESFIWDNLPKRRSPWINYNQGRTNLNENNLPRNFRCYRINQNRYDILLSFFSLCLIIPNAWIILRVSLSFLKLQFALLKQPRCELLESYESFIRESSLVSTWGESVVASSFYHRYSFRLHRKKWGCVPRVKLNRDLASRRRPKAAICFTLTQTNVTLSCCTKMPRECCHNQLK